MENLVLPLLGFGAELQHRESIFGADVQIAIFYFEFLDVRERNLEANVTTKQDFLGFEEGFALGGFALETQRAVDFLAHGMLHARSHFINVTRVRVKLSLGYLAAGAIGQRRPPRKAAATQARAR